MQGYSNANLNFNIIFNYRNTGKIPKSKHVILSSPNTNMWYTAIEKKTKHLIQKYINGGWSMEVVCSLQEALEGKPIPENISVMVSQTGQNVYTILL